MHECELGRASRRRRQHNAQPRLRPLVPHPIGIDEEPAKDNPLVGHEFEDLDLKRVSWFRALDVDGSGEVVDRLEVEDCIGSR